MIYIFKIANDLIKSCDPGSQEDSKCIAELSMALHYIKKFYPTSAYSQRHMQKLEKELFQYIHSDGYLRLLSNYFLLQQHITPYVFLRSPTLQSSYYEGLIKVFQKNDLIAQESFPYRSLERNHLLYKLGVQPITISFDAPIFIDALQIQSFNRALSYAFTHTLFYSTDFSNLHTPSQAVKEYCKFLLIQSFKANDIDLFMEVCICFLSQDINQAEQDDMCCLLKEIKQKNLEFFQYTDIKKQYHPLLVHDILYGVLHQKIGDTNTPKNTYKKGPVRCLEPLVKALRGKDANAIISTYLSYSKAHGRIKPLEEIIDKKMDILESLAHGKVLFEREFVNLGERNELLYSQYIHQLDGLKNYKK